VPRKESPPCLAVSPCYSLQPTATTVHSPATSPASSLPRRLQVDYCIASLLATNYYAVHAQVRRSLTHASRRREPCMAPQRETREGVEKRGRLFQSVVHHASRITHHASHRRRVPGRSLLCAEGRGETWYCLSSLPASSCRAPNPARRRWEAKTHHVGSVRLSIAVYSSCSEALTDCCRDASATKRRPPPTTRRRPSA
jgi:hypothetical protein